MKLFHISAVIILVGIVVAFFAQSAAAQGVGVGVGNGTGVAEAAAGATASSGFILNQNTYAEGTTTIKNVPSVSAPGIITAHNCALGTSGGISGIGGGISLGASHADENCVLISEAAALNTLAGANVAVMHLARDPEMCATLRAAGKISANSACTSKEKSAQKKSARTTTRSVKAGVGIADIASCSTVNGAHTIKMKRGYGSAANVAAAKVYCADKY